MNETQRLIKLHIAYIASFTEAILFQNGTWWWWDKNGTMITEEQKDKRVAAHLKATAFKIQKLYTQLK